MISLTREEVAEKLIDYSVLISKMHSFKNKKIKELYKEVLNERGASLENINNDCLVMLRVYQIISFLKYFSYYEETFFNSIDDSKLDFTKYKKSVNDGGIFVEGNGSNFSNKQIILFIRNAFNHNNDPKHSKFNISKNGRFIEFHLRDVRSEKEKISKPNDKKEFYIKISYENFLEMFDIVTKNIESAFVSFYIDGDSIDYTKPNLFDNAVVKRLYLPKKTDLFIIDELNKISCEKSSTKLEQIAKAKSLLQLNEEEYIKDFPLDEFQKKDLNKLFQNLDFSFMSKNEREQFIDIIIKRYIPHGMEKTVDIRNNILLLYLFGMDKSYNNISESVTKISSQKESVLSDNEKYVLTQLNTNLDIVNFEYSFRLDMFKHSYINYLFYVLNNFDDELCLTESFGKQISFEENDITDSFTLKEHIRNSLTHGWYFINKNKEFEFYDNINRRVDDYSFYYHATVPVNNLLSAILNHHSNKIYNYENGKGAK